MVVHAEAVRDGGTRMAFDALVPRLQDDAVDDGVVVRRRGGYERLWSAASRSPMPLTVCGWASFVGSAPLRTVAALKKSIPNSGLGC